MFAPITAIFVALAAATATSASAVPRGYSKGQCNTGPVQCCNTVQTAHSASDLLSALGLTAAVGQVNDLIGLDCSAVTVIGASGNGCSAHAVCCDNNSWGGIINIGCVPVDASSVL